MAQPRRVFIPILSLATLVVGVGSLLAWLSVRRYAGFNAGMLDLGNMSQAIASVLRGRPLEFTYKDGEMSRLSFHVELIYYLFVPLWAVWSDPRGLLIAQALVAVSGAIPAYLLATRRLGSPWAGVIVAAIYLLYPVAQTAILFDFHGDTLGMPLLLWAVEALDRRAWRSYALWLALALACKFYIAAPVFLLGLVIWRWGGAPRAGLLTAAAGVAYAAVAVLIIRPLFTTATTSASHRGASYLSFYFGQLATLNETMEARLINAVIVLGPALLLALVGWRWLLPGLPIIAAALLSTGPGSSFDYRYHHYALAVPFLVLAIVNGAERLHDVGRRWVSLGATALIVAGASVVFVSTPLSPTLWHERPGGGRDHIVYGVIPRDALKTPFLEAYVPDGAPIAASMFLAPRLVERETLYTVRYPTEPDSAGFAGRLPRVNYVVADGLFDWRVVVGDGVVGGITYEAGEIATLLRAPEFGLVAARDGLLLFQRDPPPGAALAQSVSTGPAPELPPRPANLGPVQLLGARLTPLGEGRVLAEFAWQLNGAAPPARPWVAVSRLDDHDDARIVHLPTLALLPVNGWRPGQIVSERFEVELPPDLPPGSYPWTVAWYDSGRPEAIFTDERSLPPGVVPVEVGRLVVP